MNTSQLLDEIEQNLAHQLHFKKQFPDSNYLQATHRSPTFAADVRAATSADFVFSAEHSYALARLLFQLHLTWYAHFCAQQAIENYLKAFLKALGSEPKLTHSLATLLGDCRATPAPSQFLTGVHVEAVILKFDAFNEFARYPVQRNRPEHRGVVSMHPDDMHALDYFVFKIRPDLPQEPGRGSLFTSGHVHLNYFEKQWPDVYTLITSHNINFHTQVSTGGA